MRWAVQRAVFHLLEEPVPTLADPFPEDDPLPGAYELHLPSDGVTIWYVVATYGQASEGCVGPGRIGASPKSLRRRDRLVVVGPVAGQHVEAEVSLRVPPD